MNREIKFRVWFNENGIPAQMIYTHLDDFIRNEDGFVVGMLVLDTYFKKGMEICYDIVNGKENWLKDELGKLSDTRYNADKSVLMQYTGLKDKNGNEIYDNDIILYHAIQERFEDIQTGIVMWDQEMSSWVMQIKDRPPGSFYFLYKSLPNDYKIIGNIFENPELLK